MHAYHNVSRHELEIAILSDKSLYACFDERRLINDDYETEELRHIVHAWAECRNTGTL